MSKLNHLVRAYRAPTINKPRTYFEMPIISNKTSLKHGVLTPIYIREVYPGDTWKGSHATFLRSDISAKVPLDDAYLDTYFFYVPYRILDKRFYEIFGDKPDPYSDDGYTAPQITLCPVDVNGEASMAEKNSFTLTFPDQLIYRLRYSQSGEYQKEQKVTAYPIWAYYDIYNYYFRDEQLDPSVPYQDIVAQFGSGDYSTWADLDDGGISVPILDNYNALGLMRANRKPDFFSVGEVSPQRGPAVSLPLGGSAPIVFANEADQWSPTILQGSPLPELTGRVRVGTGIVSDDGGAPIVGLVTDNDQDIIGPIVGMNLEADLRNATSVTINEFRVRLMTQSLYELRGTIGTRPIEQLKQWGVEGTAQELDMPEYLGGETVELSNIPVLNTGSNSELGDMAGVGATSVGNDKNKWSHTCPEMGLIIGLAVVRIKHSYPQGMDTRIWDLETDLDFYHWIFAHQGHVGKKNKMIFNNPSSNENDEVFNYSEAYSELRTDWSFVSGIFSHMSGADYIDFRTLWTYADYYEFQPYFSAEWLKEPTENVSRTLTGRLIPNANDENFGQQYMLEFKFGMSYARVLPAYSVPANLTGRW